MLKTPSRILIFFTLGAAVIVAQSPRQLPPPFATPSADNRSQVVPKPDNARVSVPNGFTADVVAEGFDTPRFMLPTAGGEAFEGLFLPGPEANGTRHHSCAAAARRRWTDGDR